MAYSIENRGGKYCVIDSATGEKVPNTSESHQINFAQETMRNLNEKDAAAEVKPKRARTAKGQLKADDPDTPDVNEAYEGGKAPKKKAKKKAKKK